LLCAGRNAARPPCSADFQDVFCVKTDSQLGKRPANPFLNVAA
jgi:hypothetical protein